MQHCPSSQNPKELVAPECHDEFGTLKVAAILGLSDPVVSDIASGVEPGDTADMVVNHRNLLPPHYIESYDFAKALRDRGVRLLYPHNPAIPLTNQTLVQKMSDEHFTRDWFGVIDRAAWLTTVQTFRRKSRNHMENVLNYIQPGTMEATDIYFPWGNAMLGDNAVLVGNFENERIYELIKACRPDLLQRFLQDFDKRLQGDRAMFERIEKTTGRKVRKVMMQSFLDLDFAIAPLPRKKAGDRKRVLLQMQLMHPEAMTHLRDMFDETIPIFDDPKMLAANIQWITPQTAILAKEATQTVALLRTMGYEVLDLPMKALNATKESDLYSGGGWRCSLAPIVRANDAVA